MSDQKNKFTIFYLILLSITPILCQILTQKKSQSIDISSIFQPTQPNVNIILNQQYTGTYNSLQTSNLFDYLDSKSGNLDVIFFNNPYEESPPKNMNSVQIFLFDPIYHDGKAVGILIKLDDIVQNKWNKVNQNITIAKFYKQRGSDQETITNVNYTLQILNLQSDNPHQVKINIAISSVGFTFTAELGYNQQRISTLGYCLYVTALVAIQIGCAYLLLRQMGGDNPNFFNKLSLITIASCNIEDFYLTMIHIEYIMEANSSYLLFILPAMAYTLLFVIFDMKLLFLVWRSHYMRDIGNPQDLRKKLTTFYIKFYVGLFVYLTLTYFFTYDGWLIIVQNLIIFPQIIHNARVGNNPGFSGFYVFGYLSLRLFLPLYQRICPSNHFLLTPMPGIIIALVLLYVIQISWLYVQYKFGSRFFIPKFLQPNYYDYDCKLKRTEQTSELQCTICLQNIFEDLNSLNLNESGVLQGHLVKQVNVMLTPCKHYFHKQCLIKWIDVKLQCPTCRKILPPV